MILRLVQFFLITFYNYFFKKSVAIARYKVTFLNASSNQYKKEASDASRRSSSRAHLHPRLLIARVDVSRALRVER